MSENAAEHRLDAYLAERAHQPFGDTDLVSGQTRSRFSRGKHDAADNLLAKADRALVAGDTEKATKFVTRAVGLPYDEYEETDPAAYAAQMLLFMAVSDTLEETPEGDTSWLDAAVDAMASDDGPGDGWGRSEMRHALLTVRQDNELDRRERRILDAATAGCPHARAVRHPPGHGGARRGGDVGPARPAGLSRGPRRVAMTGGASSSSPDVRTRARLPSRRAARTRVRTGHGRLRARPLSRLARGPELTAQTGSVNEIGLPVARA